jgi:hypothetical protein
MHNVYFPYPKNCFSLSIENKERYISTEQENTRASRKETGGGRRGIGIFSKLADIKKSNVEGSNVRLGQIDNIIKD